MEIEGEDGSRIKLKEGSETVFGRGNGFPLEDLTVSRRQISFQLASPSHQQDNQTAPRVSFEVIGRNPIWVVSSNKDGDVRAFKNFDRGELGIDDMFCVSAKNPIWFKIRTLKRAAEKDEKEKGGKFEEREIELTESLKIGSVNGELGLESIDVSNIDPVKEFGFLVIGHEFDNYPRRIMCDIKSWNWLLDDPREDTEDEDSEGSKGRRLTRRKRKKTKGNAGDTADDEDWISKSEDKSGLVAKVRKFQRPTYQTRSKDPVQSQNETIKHSRQKQRGHVIKKDDEDEEDETLGGFIVDNEDVEEEQSGEDEEEEFDEDEDEDEE